MTKAAIQMTPGDDMHLTLLMAPHSLNFVTGQDREHLLAFGRAAFEAGRTTAEQGQHQVAEPDAQHLQELAAYRFTVENLRERVAELESQLAAAPQAVQATVPLPLLVRDIARDLGITVPQACIALKPLGNYSTNSAVTAEMARMLRDHFPAPAHPAEGVPATDGLLFQCGKAAGRQEVLDEQTGPDFWEWVRRAYRNPESTSFTVHNMAVAYRAGLAATQPAAQGMDALGAHGHQERSA